MYQNDGKPYSYRKTKFITFRKSQGIMEELYKVQQTVLIYPIVDKNELENQLGRINLNTNEVNRLRNYICDRLSLKTKGMSFTLDKNNQKKIYRFYILSEEEINPLSHKPRLEHNHQSPSYFNINELECGKKIVSPCSSKKKKP
ncbi:MAG: hypothetical protein NTV89_06485 [Proteobacteria bacterium]|nr:hypothetical protein [Pseudomonadota bacterium]